MQSERRLLNLLLIASAIFYLIFIFGTSFTYQDERYFTLVDDAMISMRYARHLVQGEGLVWNVGDQPVEGFTNPGWTFYMALMHLLSLPVSKVSLTLMLSAAAILIANTYVVYRICKALLPDARYAPALAAAVTAFYFPLVFWSLRGMEVGLLTLLINLAVLLSISGGKYSSPLLAVLFTAALIVRMDAILSIGVISLYLVFKNRTQPRAFGIPLLALLLAPLAILWFQRAYFGDFIPLTYYQKVTGFIVSDRIKNGLLVFNEHAGRDTFMLFLLFLAGAALYKNLRSRETHLLTGLFLIQCAYSIWVGGDYAEVETDAANRFITQGMPALIILFSLVMDRVLNDVLIAQRPAIGQSPRAQFSVSIVLALITLAVISGKPWINWAVDNAPLLKGDIRRVKIGLLIAAGTSPEATIAVHAAGQIPYYSERRTIDLLGLNDPAIARGPAHSSFYPGHNKWNYEYSINQMKPDLIADNFGSLNEFMRDNQGYQQLENGMYIRKDSPLINPEVLSRDFK
jgi:hypothetical protein